MVNYNLCLDGVSNEDVGIRLQGSLAISAAVPKVQKISVPGRNGDLHYYDGSYENRPAQVGAYVYRPDFVKESFGEINQWLFGSFGYRVLETNDDPEHYMLAMVTNGATVEARIKKLAPFELVFDCNPRRFLNTGKGTILITKNISINNPTIFSAKPLYKINGTGNGTLTIGAHTASFTALDGYVYYDAETENAYKGTVNKNNTVNAPGGLPFDGGQQVINISGDITSVEIIPRWWEL